MAIRTARGYDAIHHPYQELYEGTRPSLQGLRPAKVLPIAMLDKIHEDDPIVILPGTFVGLLNTGVGISQSNTTNDAQNAARALVPAHQVAYLLKYGDYDVDYGTPDIDTDGVDTAAAGNSTATIGPVKPIGVLTAPVYAGSLPDKYTNYTRDLTPSVLCGNYAVMIPAITANERAIEPGDRVMIDNTASAVYAPRSVGTTAVNAAGRIMSLPDTSTGAQMEYVVGRCIHKWVVGRDTTASAGDALSATFTAGRTLTEVDADHGYDTLNRVQTVPGLGLAGSETQGIPSMYKHSRADAGGYFYALEIRIDL